MDRGCLSALSTAELLTRFFEAGISRRKIDLGIDDYRVTRIAQSRVQPAVDVDVEVAYVLRRRRRAS
jgi:hypothetical protein